MRLALGLLAASGLLSTAYAQEEVILVEVGQDETRCLGNALPDEQHTELSIEAVGGPDPNIVKARLASPVKTGTYDLSEPQKEIVQNKESVNAQYKVCFSNNGKEAVKIKVKEIINHPRNQDAINQGSLSIMEYLKKAEELATEILSEMEQNERWEKGRKGEDAMLRSRIRTLGTFTVIVLLSVGVWKLVLLNNFFRSKKLI